MSGKKSTQEADVTWNNVSIALSRHQALLNTLVSRHTSELTNGLKTSHELNTQDDDESDIESDTRGMGAPALKEIAPGESQKSMLATEDLRKKMFGKAGNSRARTSYGGSVGTAGSKLQVSKPRPKVVSVQEESDEEEGRSAVARKKSGRPTSGGESAAKLELPPADAAPSGKKDNNAMSSTKKRPSSYLDEILAVRGSKRKKKKKSRAGLTES